MVCNGNNICSGHIFNSSNTIVARARDGLFLFTHWCLCIVKSFNTRLTAELDYGSIHTWIELADDTFMDLSDEVWQNFTVEEPWKDDLTVTLVDKYSWEDSADKPPAWGYVKIGAESQPWNPMVRVDWYTDDMTRLRASGYVSVRIILPDILNVTAYADCDEDKITCESDPAYDAWGYPIYCDIAVTVFYDDGSRTVYNISAPTGNGPLQLDDVIPYCVKINETSPTDT